MVARSTLPIIVCALLVAFSAQGPALAAQSSSLDAALPANASGEQIFVAACATCHGMDGKGSPSAVVGFDLPLVNGHGFPDFTDCATNTVEPLGDWMAVAHRGGPVRALDRRMPAFGDALSDDQIERAVRYLWTFCDDPAWPRGDLNLPRALFTEKAFPENETVWTTGVTTSGAQGVMNELVYEHRIGARWQYEVKAPFGVQQAEPGSAWTGGLGDVELALRRTLYARFDRGSIFAAGGAVTVPTGKEELGFGNGFTIVEPFAMWGQMVGTSAFVQTHVGYEVALNRTRGQNEGFVRTALGYTVTQDRGFGRAWTPMLEVLAAKPERSPTEWDLVPQMQISLSKLQHILFSVGVRVPMNERDERKPQVLTYFLWDWFDGGLLEFWK
ncbi:MAG TPA: c-type cytochrome [Vicinamibacterales bacterium]|nr:c-type cytochrome [Vicinamibacterales bacterium]